MLRHLTALDINGILRSGAGATVSARQFTAIELAGMSRSLTGNAVLHVVNSQSLTGLEMSSIARSAIAPAHVSFSGVVE